MTSSRLSAVVSERFPSAGKHTWIQARSCSERQLNNGDPPDQTSSDQHRHQGLRNEAGTPSFSTRWFPPLLIRVGSRCTASSTRNRLSAPGSPSPRGAHSHPPSSHGCRPLRMQELLRNATTPFLPTTSHPAKGSRDGTRGRDAAPWPTSNGPCLAPKSDALPEHYPAIPSVLSSPVQSRHTFSPRSISCFLYTRGALGPPEHYGTAATG